MKITKESNKLIAYFRDNNNNNGSNPLPRRKQTNKILEELYDQLCNGFNYVQGVPYKYTLKRITNPRQIHKPKTFPLSAFPPNILKHINQSIRTTVTYSLEMFGRTITIYFFSEEDEEKENMNKFNDYLKYMLVWLYIVNQYATNSCSKVLKIYIYLTSLTKVLPSINDSTILNENNVNTAFTRTCVPNSEIVIFRREEWFKSFIHETFHNFALDFSDMNIDKHNSRILAIFPVHSEVNLFESYTEFWARIMNCLFCSYTYTNTNNQANKKNALSDFLTNAEHFIHLEQQFAFFQTTKVLQYMGLTYPDLYKKGINADQIRKERYKEDTNVLSYYVITLVLLAHYQDMLVWCDTHNDTLLQFKQTNANLDEYVGFIERNYRSKHLLQAFQAVQVVQSSPLPNKKNRFILNNLRMTICELG